MCGATAAMDWQPGFNPMHAGIRYSLKRKKKNRDICIKYKSNGSSISSESTQDKKVEMWNKFFVLHVEWKLLQSFHIFEDRSCFLPSGERRSSHDARRDPRRVVGRRGRAGCVCTPWWSLTSGATSKTSAPAEGATPGGWSPGSWADLQPQSYTSHNQYPDQLQIVLNSRDDPECVTWEVAFGNFWDVENES